MNYTSATNYANDHRVRALTQHTWAESFDEARMVFVLCDGLIMDLQDDYDVENPPADVPAVYQVCSTCEGKGTHVNPSVDCNGLTAEDFAEDPDFAEDYFRGVHDVTCYGCDGARVEPVLDRARVSPVVLEAIERWLDCEAMLRAEQLAELRMGA